MTVEQIEQIARSVRIWKQYQADRAYMRGEMKVWSPRMTEQQRQEEEAYRIKFSLPF